MKKVLLSLAMLVGVATQVNAQVILDQNFDAMNPGNLSSDTTGNTPGQGDLYTINGADYDYQIVSLDPNYGNSLWVMTGDGYNAQTGIDNRVVLYENQLYPDATSTYVKGYFDLYTGSAGGLGKAHITLFDNQGAIAGIGYDNETKLIIGTGMISVNGSAGYYHVDLSNSHVTDQTWVRLAFVYNMSTGQIDWIAPNGSYNLNNNAAVSYVPNLDPWDVRFYAQAKPNNFGNSDFVIDNVHIEYSSNNVLNLEDAPIKATGVKVYPNPTADILKITAKSKVDAIEIYDMSGKKIEAQLKDNEVNVESFVPGTYMIYVITKDGKTLTKFIKK